METYLDADGVERCDYCERDVNECGCTCGDCGDALMECACPAGPVI